MDKLSSEIRLEFLRFFKNNGCVVVPSDSLIPAGDKTLLFTSAGMVQFKQHFLGQSKDSFTKAASCQKCFRTSDIEQVGTTARHLTFFEMLGNFSFGDYFKKEAAAWAWEFLTKNMSLPKDKLYITVYKDDDEAAEIWKVIAPSNRIIKMDEETNFWNMGDVGPCGPCSEILIDLGRETGCGSSACSPSCSCGRYLEIWNLVFTQFDRQSDGSLRNLPQKNIDTGMGLERLIAATNGRKNVFDTDLFMPIIESAAEILKIKNEGKDMPKLRMIADHSRAAAFLISDGILPSNEGRGYVLRRILRRALRQGKFYGYGRPFINEIALPVFKIMESAYPELSSKLSSIRYVIKTEEEKFLETLESGSEMLSGIISSYKSKGLNVVGGKDVFKLYDTYGFPHDLTKEIASENGLGIDEDGFKSEQKTAREKSRAAWGGSGEKDITFYSMLRKKTGDTAFAGYDDYASEGRVLALIKTDEEVGELRAGESGEIILSQTSFYAQSGGQDADKGKIANDSFESAVEDVFKPAGNLFVHKVKILKGLVKIGDTVSAIIDAERRMQIARHHTTAHLLHKALRETFGEHIAQAGSLVARDYFRFDFTHFSAVKKNDLIGLEKKVNCIIRSNLEVRIKTMAAAEARSAGAIALFGEKYGEEVRTVSVKNKDGNGNYSMELCGGTHVGRTGDIGIFKITAESSIAAGIRRIEAVAGVAAENYILNEEAATVMTAEILNVAKEDLINKARKFVIDYKKLESELGSLRSSQILDKIDSYAKDIKCVNGINFLSAMIGETDVKSLRNISDQLKEKLKSVVLLIVSKNESKAFFIVSATLDCVRKGVDAGKIAKAFAATINGSGGGKPDFAQGGSKDLSNLSNAIKNAQELL
jgi:alanyl-tRNA synthetase